MEEKSLIDVNVEDQISKASAALAKGYSILYPTDTIWGLGCNVLNQSAVEYIREIKKSLDNEPMVLLVNSIEMIKEYAAYIHPRIETLLLHHEQPLTLIYDALSSAPDHLVSEDRRIAIRLCHDSFCNAIIYEMGLPLLATSASTYGQSYPINFESIESEIKEKVDHIVLYNQDEAQQQQPSIIASFNHKGDLEFIRS
ncbi:MAG: L-threonylcarbamoyladenylate synthase [Saprospiraceae bacterium]|jgi:L-threonylcarbamoyladenylate synthase